MISYPFHLLILLKFSYVWYFWWSSFAKDPTALLSSSTTEESWRLDVILSLPPVKADGKNWRELNNYNNNNNNNNNIIIIIIIIRSSFILSVSWRSFFFKAAVVSILLYGCTTWTLTKPYGEKAWRQLHENTANNIKQVLEVTSQKAAAVWTLTTHYKNYQS